MGFQAFNQSDGVVAEQRFEIERRRQRGREREREEMTRYVK